MTSRSKWPALLLLLSSFWALPAASLMNFSSDGFGLDCTGLPTVLDARFVTIPLEIGVLFPPTVSMSTRTMSLSLVDSAALPPVNVLGSLSTTLTSTQFQVLNQTQLFQYVLPLYVVLPPGRPVGTFSWKCDLLAGSNSIVSSTLATVSIANMPTATLVAYKGMNTSTLVWNNNSLSVALLPSTWRSTGPLLTIGSGPKILTVWIVTANGIVPAAERLVMDTREWPQSPNNYQALRTMYNDPSVPYVDLYTIHIVSISYPQAATMNLKAPYYSCPDVLLLGTTNLNWRVAQGEIRPLDDYFVELNNQGGQDIISDLPQFFFYLLNTNLDPTDAAYHWYGVPLYADARYLVFNRTTFDILGLKYPPPLGSWTNLDGTSAWTWEAYVQTARAITASGLGWGHVENPGGDTGDSENQNFGVLRQEVGASLYVPYSDRPNFGTCALRNNSAFYNILNSTLVQMYQVDKSAFYYLYDWPAWLNNTNPLVYAPRVNTSFAVWGAVGKGMSFANSGVNTNNLFDGVNNPGNPLSLALPPGKRCFLGGTVMTVTRCSQNPRDAWKLITYVTDPTKPFSGLAGGSYGLPAYLSVLSQPYWANNARAKILSQVMAKGAPSNWPQSLYLRQNVIETRLPWRTLLANIINNRNMSLHDNIQQFCDNIDDIFKPDCAQQDLRWVMDDKCDSSSLTRTVSYSWGIKCKETLEFPLPPNEIIGCVDVPSTSSAASIGTGCVIALIILCVLPAFFTVMQPRMVKKSPFFQRLLAGSVVSPSSTLMRQITRPPLIITHVTNSSLPWLTHAAGAVLLLISCLLHLGNSLTTTSCTAQLFLSAIGFTLMSLSVVGVVVLIRKRLSRTLFSLADFQKKTLQRLVALFLINVLIVVLFPFSADGVSVSQRPNKLDTGVPLSYPMCTYGDSKITTPFWITFSVVTGAWLLYAPLACLMMIIRIRMEEVASLEALSEAGTDGPAKSTANALKARIERQVQMRFCVTLLVTSLAHCLLFLVYMLISYLPMQQDEATSVYVIQQVVTIAVGVLVSMVGLYGPSILRALQTIARTRRIGRKRGAVMNKQAVLPRASAEVSTVKSPSNQAWSEKQSGGGKQGIKPTASSSRASSGSHPIMSTTNNTQNGSIIRDPYDTAFDDHSINYQRPSEVINGDGADLDSDYSTLEGCLGNRISATCLLRFARTTSFDEESILFVLAAKTLLKELRLPSKGPMSLRAAAHANSDKRRTSAATDNPENDLVGGRSSEGVRLTNWYLTEAQELYNQFIIEHAPKQINISGQLQQHFMERMKAILQAADTNSASRATRAVNIKHLAVAAYRPNLAGAPENADQEIPEEQVQEIAPSETADADIARGEKHLKESRSSSQPATLEYRFAIACMIQPCFIEVLTLIKTNTWVRFLSSGQAQECNRIMQWARRYADFSAEQQTAILKQFQNTDEDDGVADSY